MKKLRKRIFAAVLAALMMVTAMPATALYASAETVSDNAIEQAGTEDTEETVDGDTEETETDGAGETGDSDTEEPAQEPPAGPLEDDTAKCICETLCTEDSINEGCPVCGAEGADLSACKGKEQGSVPETDTEDDNADTDTAECICETLCTEDSINGDCPVCGADDASLLDCKGKVPEENTENQEDTGICKHHQEHDADCGYIPKSENGEGSPCTYECRICPIEVLIAALPDTVTEDNAADVRAQLDKILALYREMNEDEQGQLDLSHVTALQGALDAANAPMTADGSTEQQDTDEASVTINGETLYYATLEEAFAAANRQTATITMLNDAEYVHSDSNGSPLNINGGNVTLNLNGKTLSGKGYGGYGIIDVSGGSLLVQGEEGNVNVTRTGLSCRESGKLTVECITLNLVGDSLLANAGVTNQGGTVILNGTKMTGGASNGQIYQYSGTTTINDVTATGTTDSAPKSVWYHNEGTLTINGGTFNKITVDSDNCGGVTSVAELLGEGYTYRKQGGTWATDDELAAMEILNVTVEKIPLTINPKGDTSWYYNTQQTHTLAMNAAPVDSGTVTYVWKNGTETLGCTSDTYTVPAGTPVGSYNYTCEATCDGYTLSHTFSFEIKQSGTQFVGDGEVKTYNGDTLTTSFSAGDTITIKATPTATGAAPQKAAARLRGEPGTGQMALYVGDALVSSEAADADAAGTYTMTARAADVLLAARGPGTGITLTAKFIGNDNMADGTGTVTVNITAVAKAERDGNVIDYFGVSNFEGKNNLFCQNDYADATITLLGDVQPGTNSDAGTTCSTMVNITCTLDLAGHNFTSTDTAIYVLPMGNLTIQDSSTGKTGNVSFIKSDGKLTLYGGTFGKIETAYTLASLLAENCAYYRGSTPIPLSELEGQKTLDGTVTVQECQHKDVTPTSNNDGTHTLRCPYCGYTKAAEDCDYGEYTHNDTSHTRICKLCGYQDVKEHNIKCTAEASGTVIAVSEACKTCGYGKDLGTVTIHIPKLVYGDLTGVVTAETTLTETVVVAVVVDNNSSGSTVIFPFDPPTMATLTGNALLSAGTHQIKIEIIIDRDDDNELADCTLPFTVDPAPLTADMVTLGQTDVTYNGTEQKPALSVKQGETPLTEGTDYEVSYTRDGVVTTDFTNAGTVNITVTGKGNYTGSVEKTYTIGKATPTIAWNPTDVETIYTGQPADVKPVVTLVNGETYSGEIHYSWYGVADSLVPPTDARTYGNIKASIPEQDNYNTAITQIGLNLHIDYADQAAPAAPAATEENIKDTSITLTIIANAEYKRGDGEWQENPTFTGLEPNQAYTFYVRLKADRNHNASPSSAGTSITTRKAMLENASVTITGTYTYTGAAIVPEAGNVEVVLNGTKIDSDQYTISASNNINAGVGKATLTVTATETGNYSGSVSSTFTISKATLYVAPNSQIIRYGESIREGASAILTRELATGDHVVGVTLTPNTRDVPGGKIIASEVQIQNESGADVTGNYEITYVPGNLTINPAQGTLTVPAGPVTKTFGDGQFLLGCSTNGDGKISYASSDENVASVSADGNVLIKGAGEAVITVSLADGTNYTGAESQEVRITVAKAAAPAIPGETRNYTYLNGSHGAVTIDVAGKLPKDRGETTYTAAVTDGKGILSGVSIDQDGNLVYTVEANKAAGDTAVITVTAVMANYGDTAYAVTIGLVEKKTVEPQDGGSVSVKDGCILTYGQTLSDLTLETVIFVEQGTQKQVEGTLAWSNPSHVPEVADRTAQWVFTPKDNKEYEQFTGTAAITVVKATPETEAPEAAAVTYHPAGTLDSVGLNGGGAAWTVGGSAVTVEGTWGWKEPSAIPAVKNSGYTAVFTPKDTANYDTVERTVAVTVAKAEPYIATPPTAAQITYGDALDASALTGGTVQYSSSDGTAVTGSFAWKDGSIKPDSGSAAYTVVFTPADSTDYSSVETQVTLVTGKAENAPDMPPSAMNVARRFEKVGDVGLPEGWQWQDTDRDTALEIGVPVTATAVYTGADRDNYRNVTVSVTITRADCDHEHTETRNAVTATCQRKGYTGDTWCLDCGELLAKGTETDLADHSGGTATCIRGKVCQVCGTEYTGKDSANHMHTEIRGAIKAGCTSDGYTGDTYCTDCGAKTGSGRAVPAAGHDWHVTREEAATTTSEGRRIYTCSKCGQTREESIPKLPQPSHTHSYSPRETKAATCTENGVVTYSCSCGDSYTQNTAALGHSYRSEVTKQPTATSEGVMTYTCDRCGHSYTRPIAKLPGEGTTDPGTSQPGDTEPGSGSTETRPDTGIPFIKGEDGKIGWDVIRAEEEKAQEGSTINVDMNGSVVVPGDIFDSIKGKDITITFDMGNGILWSVDGKSITTDKAGDIDFSVKTGVNTVPVDIVNNVTGERYSIQISLAYEGEFGFTAVLSIGLGRENTGYTASLYYYNESTGELEFICSDEVAEDGTVSLAFTHASDYVIAIDGEQEEESGNATEPEQPDTPDKDSTGQAEESPQTGQAWRPWWIIVVGALVVIMGIGVFFVVKKGKDGDSGQV